MRIDVFYDTVCPWCRIGKRSLQLALEGWDGEPVSVRYRSFFLDPDMPPEGMDFMTNLLAKGGGRLRAEDFFEPPTQSGASMGLTFHFDAITRAPNTMLSHRLVSLAPDELQGAVLDAVYAAYFEHGQDIGDIDVLVELARSAGMDADETRAALQGDAGEGAVLADVNYAQQVGISAVPFFIFNEKYAFSGAQPPHSIRNVMAQVAAEDPGQ